MKLEKMSLRKLTLGLTAALALLLAAGGCYEKNDALSRLRAKGYDLMPMYFTIAAGEGDRQSIDDFFIIGIDVNEPTPIGETAISRAAAKGRLEVVQLLLDKGANPNLADEKGRTPLSRAQENGHQQVVELLKKAGAK